MRFLKVGSCPLVILLLVIAGTGPLLRAADHNSGQPAATPALMRDDNVASWRSDAPKVILASVVSAAQGQAGSAAKKNTKPASMNGTITDMSGNPIPGATFSVTGAAGIHQSVVADAKGNYSLTGLPPGIYDVSVSAPGFKVFDAPGVELGAGDTLPLDATLESEKASPAPESAPASAPTAVESVAPPAAATGGAVVSPSGQTAMPSQTTTLGTTVHADKNSGTITGTVADQSGAVIVGAVVAVTNASGLKHTGTSNAQGVYVLSGLQPGTYDLSASSPGFKSFQAPGITVPAGIVFTLDAMLEPGGEKTEINVEAGGPAEVSTENAEVSGTITQKEVQTLGLNGRNFTQLITLAPGVSNQTGQDEAKVGVQGSVKYSVNGGRVEYNSFEVDGSDVLNAGLSGAESTLVVYASLDAIQEVKVLTSNYGAQYGRTASGTVQVTTKSGGNHWHGGAYEYFRNEFMNARNYFDQTTKAPLYRRNDFGFNVGGPVKKDKTYIFFSEELRYEKSPSELQSNFNHAVPTFAERQGDFSDVCPNPNDPEDLKSLVNVGGMNYNFPITTFPDCPGVPNGTNTPGYRRLFSRTLANGNTVYNNLAYGPNTGAGLDPNALAILGQNLVPLANSYTGCNSSLVGQFDHTTGQPVEPCYDAVISLPTHWREELFRLDHNFTSRVHSTLRFIHDAWNTTTPTPVWTTQVNTFPTVQNSFVGPGLDVMVRVTQTFTPSLLNEALFSFTNSNITLNNANGPGGANYQRPAGLGEPTQVGQCTTSSSSPVPVCPMGYFFNNGFGGKVPGVIVTGDNQAYGGAGFAIDPAYMPWDHTNPTYNFRDDLSKALTKHTLHFGVQFVLAQKNETNGALGAASGDTQGLVTFSNVNGGAFNTGNAFANLLYNVGNTAFTGGGNAIKSYTQDSTQRRYYNRYKIAEPYIQDDWRFNSRLTINLGLRLSLFGNYYEKYMQSYNWDPKAFSSKLASEVVVDPYSGQLLDSQTNQPIPFKLNNLDPRISNGIVRCGVNGVPSGCIQSHIFNPAPRIGFAWDPQGNGKTSIRAGYGIFYEHGTGVEANTGSLEASAPGVINLTQPFPAGYACIGNYSPACDTSGNGITTLPGAFPINVTAIPTNTKYSYSQQWSLSVERQFPKDFVGTFAYVGSKGTHLTVERQLNQVKPVPASSNPFGPNEAFLLAVPGSTQADCDNLGTITQPVFILQNGTTVSFDSPASVNMQIACQGQSTNSVFHPPIAVANTFRQYYGLGEIFELQNGADSAYNAFQTTLRRTRGPLTLGIAYSFSHSIDDSSDRTDPTFVNSLDLRSNKASSNYDQRHLLNVSYVYAVPKLSRGFSRALAEDPGAITGSPTTAPTVGEPSRVMRALLDNWKFSGITTYQSGTPFSVINNAGSSGIGVLDNAGVANGVGAGSFPDIAPNPAPPALKSNPSSFGPLLGNPNEFVAPRGLTFGDAGRNFLDNPSRINFDMSLLKNFPVREGSGLEFRAEAFNVFNHTQFRLYDPSLGNTGSNTISCYGGSNYSAGAYFPGGTDCLTGSAFLHPVDAHRGRTLQLALKYTF